MTTTTLRTPTEIHERIKAVRADDWLGFRREILVPALPFGEARRYLKADAEITEAGWKASQEGAGPLDTQARAYLEFAIGKIDDHRGISASRSVEKLTEYAWLLGRDDVVTAMDEEPYGQYGAPKVKAFATGMGYPWPDDADLNRMASGEPCRPGCEDGCGQ
jgi:hypothetical protein